MENTKTNKILVGIILILLLLLAFRTCKSIKKPSTNVNYSTIVSDTNRVTLVDTIPFYNIKDSIRWHNLPIISKVPSIDSTEWTYVTAMNDSLINGTITTKVKNTGELKAQDFTYVPKFPKYIVRTDSITITNTITNTITEPDWGIYGGLMVSPYKNLSLIATAGLKTKKDMYFGLGFDPFKQNVYLDIKFKLFNK